MKKRIWQLILLLALCSTSVMLARMAGRLPRLAAAARPAVWQAEPACALPAFRRVDTNTPGREAVATGDFNQDGFPDLVKATRTNNYPGTGVDVFETYVLRGDGNGNFSRVQTIPIGPLQLHSGDFNGDGITDVLAVMSGSYGGFLLVYYGRREGDLVATPTNVTLPAVTEPTSNVLTLADLNSDGRTDVLAKNAVAGKVHVLLGSSGGLQPPGAGLALDSVSLLTAADLNFDGAPDLLFTQFGTSSKVQWLAGRGDGTFQSAATLYTAQSGVISLAVADFDQAGQRDLLLATGYAIGGIGLAPDSGQLILLQRRANEYVQRSSLKVSNGAAIVQVVDVNNDKKPDIFWRYNRAFSSSAFSDPKGASAPLILNDGAGGMCPATGMKAIYDLEYLADLNRDGRTDVIKTGSVYLNEGGRAGNTPPMITLPPEVTEIVIGEFSHSGIRGVAVDAETPGSLLKVTAQSDNPNLIVGASVFNDDSLSAFVSTTCAALPGEYSFTISVTDEAGATATATVRLRVKPLTAIQLLRTDLGSSQQRITLREGLTTTLSVSAAASNPEPSEFNYWYESRVRDRKVFLDDRELVGTLYIGSSGNAPNYFISASAGEHILRIVLTDKCSDVPITYNIPITVIGATTECVYPAFTPLASYETGSYLTELLARDFNDDGRMDALVYDADSRQLKAYFTQSNGTLQLANTTPLAGIGRELHAADFNRDGKLDLAFDDGGLTIMVGDGSGKFALLRKYSESYWGIGVGEFNNDGFPDLAAETQGLTMRALLNDGKGGFSYTVDNFGTCGGDMVVSGGGIITNQIFPHSRFVGFVSDGKGNLGRFNNDSTIAGSTNFGTNVYRADFDGDGRLDYAARFGSYDVGPTRDEGLFYIQANAFRQRFFQMSVGALSAADLNLDGKPDVMLSGGNVIVAGTPAPYCAIAPSFAPNIRNTGVGDVNGDGKPDVITIGSGGLRVFLNQTAGRAAISLSTVSAAFHGDTLAPGQLAASFGTALATSTQSANEVPLTTSLAGTRVIVRDSIGVERPAPLLFVSPGQVNFQLPTDTAIGIASIQITNSRGTIMAGTVPVVAISPSLFTFNATGKGLAAAQALRILADGTQRYEPIARYDEASKQFVALPIDLSNASEQVFLVLYGTGLRGRSALSAVTTTVGDTVVETLYAGAQGALVGLDQVNVRLPRSLAGRGEVEVSFTADGKAANAVRVTIK